MAMLTVRPKVRPLCDERIAYHVRSGKSTYLAYPVKLCPYSKHCREDLLKTQATSIELTYVLESFDAVLPPFLSSPTNHLLLKIPANSNTYANGTAL